MANIKGGEKKKNMNKFRNFKNNTKETFGYRQLPFLRYPIGNNSTGP